MTNTPGPETRLAAVIGKPVRHSLSPAMMNAAFAAAGLDWAYVAFEVGEGDAPAAVEAMRVLGLAGLNVTMPAKQAVAGAVEELSTDAALLGAVNCVRREGDRLIGENTDGPGLCRSLEMDEGIALAGRTVCLIGAGGAARSVALAFVRAGVDRLVVLNRTASAAEELVALVPEVGEVGDVVPMGTDLLVNATPVGMGEQAGSPVPEDALAPAMTVVDLVYHPTVTPLLRLAAARGCRTVGGLGMLVHQAALSFEHWTGTEPDTLRMRQAAEGALSVRSLR